MSFFKGPFRGQSNEQVIKEWTAQGIKAIEARRTGRRDRDAEKREEAASTEMKGRWREENANPEAAMLVSRWERRKR